MNRKAIAIETLGVLVVLSVLLIFIIIFAIKAATSTNKFVEDSECSKNIKAHAFLLKTSGEAIASDIYCPTKYYTLSGKNVDEIKYSLAEAMRTCWGTWGKGRLDLFKGEGYYCHIHSVIDFKDKNTRITDFSDYLANTNVDSILDISYLDYLTGYANEKADQAFTDKFKELRPTGTIDTSKTYAVMFLYAKGDEFIKDMLEGIGSTTAGGGAILGTLGGVATGILIVKGLAVVGVSAGTFGLGGLLIGGGALIGGLAGGIFGWSQANQVQWYAITTLQEYSSESLKRIGCQITPVKQDKIQGVSG